MNKQTLLIPLDGSEFSRQILPYVMRFMDPVHTDIILLHVAAPTTGLVSAPPRMQVTDGWMMPLYESARDAEYAKHPIYNSQEFDSLLSQLNDEFRPLVRELERAGYTVSTAIRFGEPAPEIITFVQNEDIDLLAMATHGRTGIGRLLLGSVAEYVLRHAPAPILLVRPSAEETPESRE